MIGSAFAPVWRAEGKGKSGAGPCMFWMVSLIGLLAGGYVMGLAR